MTAGDARQKSDSTAEKRLQLAIVISLLLHAGAFGLYKHAEKKGWKELPTPEWLKKLSLAKLVPPPKPAPKKAEELKPTPPELPDIPLMFIEVDPLLAEKEAPKDAKYYSALSSKAANVEIKVESKQPDIDGKQTIIPKTTDTLRPQPPPPKVQPPEPPAPVAKKQEEVKAEQPKPKGEQKMGDLALAKPAPTPTPEKGKAETKAGDSPEAKLPRPRTVAEAVARQNTSLSGQKMKQEGGVPNRRIEPSVDAIGSPFGQYDWGVFSAIEKHWNDLLRSQQGVPPAGRVVIEFRLQHTGKVSDVHIIENTVGDLFGYICQRSITAPSPYPAWPSDMRRMVKEDYRQIRITFHYTL